MGEEAETPPSRLDRIATQWSLVQRAHGKLDTTARAARNDLVMRYVRNYWARENRRRPVDIEAGEMAEARETDAAWVELWRESVLEITWAALRRIQQQQPDQHDCTLLTLRIEHPDDTSEQLAERLSARLGSEVRADALRQKLRRARRRFAVQLLSEIASGLPNPSVEAIEQELIDLELYERIRGLLPDDWKQAYESEC